MMDHGCLTATKRLVLSYLQPSLQSHCDFIVKLYNTQEFIASIGGKPTAITSPEAARKLIENRFQAEYARNGYGTYLVSLKTLPDDPTPHGSEQGQSVDAPSTFEIGEPIGTVSLSLGTPPNAYSVPDLGFAIVPEQMGKGYATEAAKGLLMYAEKKFRVHDVLGLFDPTNEVSKGVFRSLGFVDRGVRALKVFGNVQGAVWAKEGMAEDLSVYGL